MLEVTSLASQTQQPRADRPVKRAGRRPPQKENVNLEICQANQLSEVISDEDLIAQYRPHCHAVAWSMRKSYRLSREDAEDIESIAMAQLPNIPQAKRGIPDYVRGAVNNTARTALRKLNRHNNKVWGVEPQRIKFRNAETRTPTILDRVTAAHDGGIVTVEAIDRQVIAHEAWEALSPTQQVVMDIWLGLSAPPVTDEQSVARVLGIRPCEVLTAVRTGMVTMRRVAGATGINLQEGKL